MVLNGPPFVITSGSSKTFSDPIIDSVMFTVSAGARRRQSIARNRLKPVAPSTAAASKIVSGMAK